jgi:sulfur carrier protein
MAGIVSSSPGTFTLQCGIAVAPCVCGDAWRPTSGDNSRMNIQLNGKSRQISPTSTLSTLLMQEGLAERRVAVEVNGEIIPRGQHGSHALRDGDQVEIVHALGGG